MAAPRCRVARKLGKRSSGRPGAGEEGERAACCTSCLEAAAEEKLESIAFCCISTGEVGFPRERAAEIAGTADLMVVVGTSLAVYPAASLVRYVRPDVPIFLVDPGNPDTAMIRNPLTHIRSRAAEGMPELAERLKSEFS